LDLRLDSAGAATTDSWSATNLDHFLGDAFVGSLPSSVPLGYFQAQPVDPTPSLFPAPKQKGLNRAHAISVKVTFGPQNRTVGQDGDNLSFIEGGKMIGQPDCSENLGPLDCSSIGTWRWNLEGKAVAADPVVYWTVQQSVEFKQKGFYKDSHNALQPFSCPVQGIGFNADDGPRSPGLQKNEKTIFWIDAPGSFTLYNVLSPCSLGGFANIDSMTLAANFTAKYTNSVTNYVRTVRHFIVLHVSPGGVVDLTKSRADYGRIPLSF
jgi:hypothetical protein